MDPQCAMPLSRYDGVAIDALVAHDPLLNRHAVARLGLRIGLQALAREPGRIHEMLRGHGVRLVSSGDSAGGVR